MPITQKMCTERIKNLENSDEGARLLHYSDNLKDGMKKSSSRRNITIIYVFSHARFTSAPDCPNKESKGVNARKVYSGTI